MEVTLQTSEALLFYMASLFQGMLLTVAEGEDKKMIASNYRKVYKKLSIGRREDLHKNLETINNNPVVMEKMIEFVELVKNIK